MERNFGQSFSPVKVGDELDVEIEAVGEKGDGIAKKDGFVLFVPNTSKGQKARIKIIRVLRKVGFAEVVGEGSQEQSEQPSSEQGEQSSESPDQEAPKEEEKKIEDTEDFGEDLETDSK